MIIQCVGDSGWTPKSQCDIAIAIIYLVACALDSPRLRWYDHLGTGSRPLHPLSLRPHTQGADNKKKHLEEPWSHIMRIWYMCDKVYIKKYSSVGNVQTYFISVAALRWKRKDFWDKVQSLGLPTPIVSVLEHTFKWAHFSFLWMLVCVVGVGEGETNSSVRTMYYGDCFFHLFIYFIWPFWILASLCSFWQQCVFSTGESRFVFVCVGMFQMLLQRKYISLSIMKKKTKKSID